MAVDTRLITDEDVAERLKLGPEDFERLALARARSLGSRDPRRAWLHRALTYPYQGLPFSFVYSRHELVPLVSLRLDTLGDSRVLHDSKDRSLASVFEGVVGEEGWNRPRFPLLCYGANASLQGLERKLRGLAGADGVLPLVYGELRDVDVVYSPHLSSYGALPATLQYKLGSRTRLAVAHVTNTQLTKFAATEVNYRFGCLRDVHFESSAGGSCSQVYTFVSRHGCLAADSHELALSAITAPCRLFDSVSQRQALNLVAIRLGVPGGAEELIMRTVEDYAWAVAQRAVLAETARPFEHPHWREHIG